MNVEVQRLTAGYEGTSVVRDVSLSVADGEIVGVMGRNGVGKTTLLKAIMGLLDVDTGTVRLGGEPVAGRGAAPGTGELLGRLPAPSIDAAWLPGPVAGASGRLRERLEGATPGLLADSSGRLRERLGGATSGLLADAFGAGGPGAVARADLGVGYVPQGRDVFPGLTVEQNLTLGERVGGDDATLYDRVHEYFPILEERADQDAGTLSGGQQQMLAIGRALVGDPDLLLVDEPSEGIQPSIVQSITEDLARINEDLGTTILFVEQNVSVLQGLADRCYAMDKGRIVDELDADELGDRERLADHLAV